MTDNQFHLIPLDLYMRDVALIVGTWNYALARLDDQLGKHERRELKDSKPGKQERGRFFFLNSGLAVIWIRPRQSPETTASTLIHEITHASFGILDKVGISPCRESEEAYAYLTEYLAWEAWKKLEITLASYPSLSPSSSGASQRTS